VPDGRQPLPGEDGKPFLEWQGFLLSDASREVRGHALRVRQTASAERWAPELVTADAELAKARAVMLRLVASRLGKAEPSIPVGWFGEDAPPGPDTYGYRARAAQLIAIGAGLLGFAGWGNESQVRALLGLAFGFDALHVSFGDFLGGDPLFPDPPTPPPGGFQGIKDLPDGHCVLGIGAALGKFAAVASQRPRPWAQGAIMSVAPRRACPGDVISILGSGFGASQPAGVEVRMTAKGGGCVAADVVSWSDTQIQVRVPPDAGHGCVGLIENPAGFGEIFSVASDLAGEIETCLGLAGFGAGRAIREIGGSVATVCPSCGDPATAFEAGPPVIDVFAADNALVGSVAPGGTVMLSWSVIGADSVSIDPQPAGSLPAIPGPLAPDRGTAQAGPLPLQDGDRGTYVLTAANGCGTVTRELDIVCRGKRALALSGGGTKGAFEVGAARCLYDVAGLRPDIISGASVGALNAAKLAEGPAALSQLEALWLGLTTKDDFYLEPGWFQTLDPLVRALLSSGASNIGGQIAAFVISYAADKIWGKLAEAFGVPGLLYDICTSLYPVVTKIIDAVRLIDAAVQALNANALFINVPLVNLITLNIDPAKISASGIRLRVAMVSLETAATEVVTEHASLVSTGHTLPLQSVLLASASIPGAFPPVAISGTSRGTEHFVDGGTRDNVPIREAVMAGADRVDAVMLSPRQLSFKTGFGQAKLIDIAPRAMEILLDEIQLDDIAPFRGFGVPVTVAAPTFLVHDTLTVDPGLISINLDYGYMRAYDDLIGPAADRAALRASTDDIILTRLDAWTEEHFANGERLGPRLPGSPLVLVPSPTSLQNVRDMKMDVRTKTEARITRFGSDSMPKATAPWWQAFERHPWQPVITDPWQALNSQAGMLPAAPMPPP
jgi:predicted acylesterase/phospholipase RssA